MWIIPKNLDCSAFAPARRRQESRDGTGPAGEAVENSSQRGPAGEMGDTKNDHRRSGERGEEEGTRADELGRGRPAIADQGQVEPPLGGDTHGHTHRLDYAELCESSDSRIDELRLCGNGVVIEQAELAFGALIRELIK